MWGHGVDVWGHKKPKMKLGVEERPLEKNTLKYKEDRSCVNINTALCFLPTGFNFVIIKFAGQLHFGNANI